jgi:hypothetical protein
MKLLWEKAKPNEEFRNQKRQKQNASDREDIQTKRSNNNASIWSTRIMPQILTQNYFAPPRIQMEVEDSKEDQTVEKFYITKTTKRTDKRKF